VEEAAYLSALAGLLGATIGGMTSFGTAWLTQRNQVRNARREAEKVKREALFGDFVTEATRLYADALSHEKDDVTDLVRLYALVAKMRLIASREVITSAEQVMDSIIETYLAPNRDLRELRDLAHQGRIDFLVTFGEACRRELALMTE
jgi:hypothetical protein